MTTILTIYTFVVMSLSWLRGTDRFVQWVGARNRGFSDSAKRGLILRAISWYALSLVSAVLSVILFYYMLEF